MTEQDITALAERTGFSVDAVRTMLDSVAAGHGRMAQFDHPEFGGFGQWMRGGMVMLATGFDDVLRQRVAGLCDAVAAWLDDGGTTSAPRPSQSQSQSSGPSSTQPRSVPGGGWWPQSLGAPDVSGSQNDMRYAWFADARRLAVEDAGQLTIYDTGDHRVGGVSQQQGQQQGGTRSLFFTGRHGRIDTSRLPVVGVEAGASSEPTGRPERTTVGSATDPFVALEKLGALYVGGILTDAEFTSKKAELLKLI